MKARILPPLDDDEIETHTEFVHTWKIADWTGLPPHLFSDTFEGGDFTWRIYLFPEGNHTSSVSIYLDCAPKNQDQDAPVTVPHWSCCAQFGVLLWNPENPAAFAHNVASHRFCEGATDWGFSQFHDLRGLFMPQDETGHAIIEGNQVNISAYVRIVKDPTGVLWHNFIDYNSKKETGYSGMKNQGATCYLNSLLQSLYHTTAFRHAVMGIPTEDEPNKVPAALQRLFCQLQTSDSVDTLKLTQSFGWDSAEAFTQHDVQELNRVLMDNLEGKMKGTSVEGMLNKVFVGQMKSYIKCENVDFESSRIEEYWDIQLNVKGMETLEDSFHDYVQVETLDGENQYQATGHGLQDAKKGVVFTSFPPVLHLQLKRYDFDFVREIMVKINDRYEFSTEIDLAPFLDKSIVPEESCEYALHGVLVHCGDLNIGHYYALIKPEKDGHWYRFDDERVTRATMKEVLEDNFGGDVAVRDTYKTRASRQSAGFKRHTSAYMLVYIRKSRLDEILYQDAIPEHIQARVQREVDAELVSQREKEEQHLYVKLKIATVAQFQNMHHFDIAVWDEGIEGLEDQPVEAQALSYKVKKTASISELLAQVATSLNCATPERLRLWTMDVREGRTRRLSERVDTASTHSVEGLMGNARRGSHELHLFLEEEEEEGEPEVAPIEEGISENGRRVLLFVKEFDVATQNLHGVLTWVGRASSLVKDLVPDICKALGWPSEAPVRILEEVGPSMTAELDQESTLDSAGLEDGNVVCVERIFPDFELSMLVPPRGHVSAKSYYKFLRDRVLLTFRTHVDPDGKDIMETETKPDVSLWLSLSASYNYMAQMVGDKLGVDFTHLQFFSMHPDGSVQRSIRRGTATVSHMISTPYRNHSSNRILTYEVLRMSLAEYERNRLLHVTFLTEGLSQEHRYEILLPRTSAVAEIMEYLVDKCKLSSHDEARLVLWTCRNHIVFDELTGSTPIASIDDDLQVYGQLLSDEEYEWQINGADLEKGKTIRVFQYHRDPIYTHGLGFMFLLLPNEEFKDTKIRLQKKLGMYDKVFERIKFSVIKNLGHSRVHYIDDEQVVLFDCVDSEDAEMIGLDHVNKTPRRVRGEHAIFIKN